MKKAAAAAKPKAKAAAGSDEGSQEESESGSEADSEEDDEEYGSAKKKPAAGKKSGPVASASPANRGRGRPGD